MTTAVGFAALMSANIPPVRVFGAFVSVGVLVAWFLSVTFNPAFAVLLPKRTLSKFGLSDDSGFLLARMLRPGGLAWIQVPQEDGLARSRVLGNRVQDFLGHGVGEELPASVDVVKSRKRRLEALRRVESGNPTLAKDRGDRAKDTIFASVSYSPGKSNRLRRFKA